MKRFMSLLEKRQLTTKLVFGFGIGLIITLMIGVNSITSLISSNNQSQAIYEQHLLGITHTKEANINLAYMERSLRQMVLAKNNFDREKAHNALDKADMTLQLEINEAFKTVSEPEHKKKFGEILRLLEQYRHHTEQATSLLNESETGQNEAQKIAFSVAFMDIGDKAENLLSDIAHDKEESALVMIKSLATSSENNQKISIELMVFGLLLDAIFGLMIGRSIARPSSRLKDCIENLAQGDLNSDIPYLDYENEIGETARALKVLQEVCKDIEAQRWVKEHVTKISIQLQQAEGISSLSKNFMSLVCPLINSGHGVFYMYSENQLFLLGSYGFRKRKNLSQNFALGEGLVGQCAAEKKLITLTNPPADYITINSGLGESVPKNIMVLPVLHGDVLVGVLELAAFHTFTVAEQSLLDELMPRLAMSLEILERNIKTQHLLEESQKQAELMEAQAVRMEQQTVELETQQAELKHTEKWYTSIIEFAPMGICVVNEAGQIVLCNPSLNTMFGYDLGELNWKNVDELVPLEIRAAHPKMREKFMAEMCVARPMAMGLELRGIRKDGSEFPVEVGLSHMPELEGGIKNVCVSVRDVSIAKKAVNEVRAAKELAEEATRMKSDFLANMSHEIRTPLNAIIGMSHLAFKTDLTLRQRDYVSKIQGAGEHLLGVINDILDFSKIEAGKLTIEQSDFELDDVLSNLANLIAEKIHNKGIELVFDIDKNVPKYLNGDALRLGQILINYGNNAFKFTEAGEIVISTKVLEETETEVFLHFAVRDTGIGLSPHDKTKLFQSFQQADTSISRKYGGTGLGLAIVKQLAELMGGNVGVDSEIGKGSTFWFTARLGKGKGAMRSLLPNPDLRGLHVLVVDDNEIARAVLSEMLSNMAFDVHEAESGKEALVMVQKAAELQQHYDLVFLDWRMPEMDGIETAKAIRLLPLDAYPHLIMVTAYVREDGAYESEGCGLEGILIKPVNASLLFDTTMRILNPSPMTPPDFLHISDELAILEGASILIVEDNELNQEVAMGLLADFGFNIAIANNGQEAVDMVEKGNYDIVLMDMQMPVMNGVMATIEIRKDARFAALPIVAMTANAMAHDEDVCANAGMNDHVAKPIDPDELFRVLLKWIKPKVGKVALMEKRASTGRREEDKKFDHDLQHIGGLDVELGLKRVIGKKPLYLNMLRKYVTNQENTPSELRAALAANNQELAERIAHSAKGVSGNIGATRLQNMADELEKMINGHAPRDVIDAQIMAFETVQTTMITALKTALPADKSADVFDYLDTSKAVEVLTKLSELLKDDDSEAIDILEENIDLLRVVLGTDTFSKVDKAIKDFDFEKAIVLLENVAL